MRERLLVVNADDFGLSPGTTLGILHAHRHGVVTSTSVIVTQPDWPRTAHALGLTASLDVGLHVDLLTGTPMISRGTLVNPDTGRFYTLGALIRRAVTGRIATEDVARECHAQLRRLQLALADTHTTVTHIDSHRHTHVLPVIATGLRRAARMARVPAVRYPVEWLPRRFTYRGRARALTLHGLAALQRARPTDRARAFIGASWQGASDFAARLEALPQQLESSVSELMCHPGYVDDALLAVDSFTTHRECELAALCADGLRERWAATGIRLVGFGEVADRVKAQ
jgi:chitin disaccharide deacetylase